MPRRGDAVVKNLSAAAADATDPGLIPGSGRSTGEGHGNLCQYSGQENPTGLQRVGLDCAHSTCQYMLIMNILYCGHHEAGPLGPPATAMDCPVFSRGMGSQVQLSAGLRRGTREQSRS